jgi:hypothetical protein
MSKKKRKKPNPNRVPATKADVKKAKEKARTEAIELVWSIFFTVLRDKRGYTLEDLQETWKDCDNLSDSIAKGYCTVSDLRTILNEEEGIHLT